MPLAAVLDHPATYGPPLAAERRGGIIGHLSRALKLKHPVFFRRGPERSGCFVVLAGRTQWQQSYFQYAGGLAAIIKVLVSNILQGY